MQVEDDYRKMAIDGIVRVGIDQIDQIMECDPELSFAEAFSGWSETCAAHDDERNSLAEEITSFKIGHYWRYAFDENGDSEEYLDGVRLCTMMEEHVDQLFRELCNGSEEIYKAMLAIMASDGVSSTGQ